MSMDSIYTKLPKDMAISRSLEENIANVKTYTNGSTDVIIKRGMVCCNNIAVFMCEGMAGMSTVSTLVYEKLNDVGNKEKLLPDALMERLFNVYLTAVEQIEVKNLGDLVLKMHSGFAVILAEGSTRCIAIGVQGFQYRSVSEPETELNVRGSREGFVEVIRFNMAMVRRRIKSPTLVFELSQLGERSKTDIALCYISDKVSPKLVADVKKRLKHIKLNTILESGYIQPFLEGKGNEFFSECGICERPDVLAAKLYEGRVGILVDGTPIALVVPTLFIESFQTLDDYTQKPYYAVFLRIVRMAAFIITLFLPGAYVAIASFSPELLPSALLLNLAAAEQAAPFSLLTECLMIHFMYEILREAGIRLPKPIGSALGVVGGLVIGDITVSTGLVGAPMVLIVALSGLCSFVVPSMYERVVVLRFVFIFAGGLFGLFGLALAGGAMLLMMCRLNTYGVPYMAPISPFTAKASRDMLVRSSWRRMESGDVDISNLNGAEPVGGSDD